MKKEVFERTIVEDYTAQRDFTGYSLQETKERIIKGKYKLSMK